ncbi:MAG: DNA polymerase III subunit gamma/tau [Bacilli bacterium]|nr:DNA polymerase III subunit gamma/tau [Bacilli bacterium]
MHYLALYRKYRPTNFNEVVGQDKVITVIKNEIINNRISHAYLFSGPRGTGKTTTAKIIAKLVNCTNPVNGECCNKCDNCLNFKNSSDIVEIDAASNNGVDEIRELRDKVNLVPTNSKYKIYIIDEVHMLTTQAFNALLKTLEEPPAHVIFILATTEPHKIPLTVASRCQKFQFSKISNDEIVHRLSDIINEENIKLDNEILLEIARLSDGGLRDAINMLDQLLAYKSENITLMDVYNINSCVSYIDIYNFINNMMNNNAIEIVNFIEKIDSEGKNISKFIEELIVFLKDILLYKSAKINSEIEDKNAKIKELSDVLSENAIYNMIYSYNDTLNNIKLSSNSIILFIVSTFKIINDNFIRKNNTIDNNNESISTKNIEKVVENVKNEEKKVEVEDIKKLKEEITSKMDTLNELINTRINNTFVYANKKDLLEIKDKWNSISNYLLNEKYGVNCGILKEVNVVAAGNNNLILVSNFDSVVDKVNMKLAELESTLLSIFGNQYKIIAISNDRWNSEKEKYVLNIKKGNKYELIEEKSNKNDNTEKTPVDELIDLIGEDLVEID